MGGIANLTSAMARLAEWTGTAADQMERAGRAAPETTRVPEATRERTPGESPASAAPSLRTSFRAGSNVTGPAREVASDVGDALDSADELAAQLAAADAFFKSSSIGKVLEKVLSGYAVGTAAGGTALTALQLVENYLRNRTELQSGRADADRQFVLKDSIAKQTALFERFFGRLGNIGDVARELQKFRQRFPDFGGDSFSSASGPTSGTLGKPKPQSCGGSTSLDLLAKSGSL